MCLTSRWKSYTFHRVCESNKLSSYINESAKLKWTEHANMFVSVQLRVQI